MAQNVMAYPFKLDPTIGGFAVTDDETDTYKAQAVSAFLRTQKGERPMFYSFGITNPLFHEFDSGDFFSSFSDFYSSGTINISEISVASTNGAVSDVAVSFN